LLHFHHQSLQTLLYNKRLFVNHLEGNHHRCRPTIILSSPVPNSSQLSNQYRRPHFAVPLQQLNLRQASVFVVAPDTFHYSILQSIRPKKANRRSHPLLPQVVSQLSNPFGEDNSRVHHGLQPIAIFFASASSFTTSINAPRCVVTIAGQS
jgi:hypothetical protein